MIVIGGCAVREEVRDRRARELGHAAIKLVAEFSLVIHEADLLAMLGLLERALKTGLFFAGFRCRPINAKSARAS